MLNFRNVRFLKSGKNLDSIPPMPQIALLGRSNVGKSSLLNDLFQRQGMAKTSSTPGKTQLLNFFLVDEKLLCVDLPGYGYAKVAGRLQREWSSYMEDYLNTAPINLALLLLDVRRNPSDLDIQMYDWLVGQAIPTLLVLTKVDKVSKNERAANTRKITEMCHFPYIHYSVTKREGRQQLLSMIQSKTESKVVKPATDWDNGEEIESEGTYSTMHVGV